MDNLILKVENLSKKYGKHLKSSMRYGMYDIAAEFALWRENSVQKLRPNEFWALRNISFELKAGEALGVIGQNGAGKSTLLKLLHGLIKPDTGRIEIHGRVGALIEMNAGFNPVLTGRENIYTKSSMLGISKRETEKIIDQIIEFADIGDFIDSPVKNYSSGMWLRLGYAIAAQLNPGLLLVDEVLAVGDLTFRVKCLRHMQKYLQNGGALVLVSHNLYLMQAICQKGILLDRGRVVFEGSAVDAVNSYFERQQEIEIPGEELIFQEGEHIRGKIEGSGNGVDNLSAEEIFDQENITLKEMTIEDEKSKVPDHRSKELIGEPLKQEQPKKLIIKDVEILPVLGNELHSGESVRIVVNYYSPNEIDNLFWGFMIFTMDQLVCITLGGDGYSGVPCRVNRGHGSLSCRIPKLPLVNGTYALKVIIGDLATRAFLARLGWENSPKFFSVKSDANEVENVYSMANALVKIDVEPDD